MSPFINIFVVTIMLIALPFSSVIAAANTKDAVLIMQLMVSPTVFGIDTIYRMYSYAVNGILHSIVDTPRTIYHPTYSAEYDTIGNIKKLIEYRDTLVNSTEFFWEDGNRIRFDKQWNNAQKKESGTIVYYGNLRSVDLPENNSFAQENYLLVRADSTQYIDNTSTITTTWVWTYDSLDNIIKWQSRVSGQTELQWVEEYSYRYYANGLVDRRSPALAGNMLINFYGHLTIAGHNRQLDKINNSNLITSVIKNKSYLVNGRMAFVISSHNKLNTSVILLKTASNPNSKHLITLSGKIYSSKLWQD